MNKQFLSGYIEAAFWSTTNEEGEPLDAWDPAPGQKVALALPVARWARKHLPTLERAAFTRWLSSCQKGPMAGSMTTVGHTW